MDWEAREELRLGAESGQNGRPIACSPQNNAVIKRAADGRPEESCGGATPRRSGDLERKIEDGQWREPAEVPQRE
jgi:hypothetical protein